MNTKKQVLFIVVLGGILGTTHAMEDNGQHDEKKNCFTRLKRILSPNCPQSKIVLPLVSGSSFFVLSLAQGQTLEQAGAETAFASVFTFLLVQAHQSRQNLVGQRYHWRNRHI